MMMTGLRPLDDSIRLHACFPLLASYISRYFLPRNTTHVRTLDSASEVLRGGD